MPRPASPRLVAQLTALKNQARQLLELAEEDIVLIRQLDCTQPGCPPVETVVAVLPPSGTSRRWTLHHPVDEITPDLLAAALAATPTVSESEGERA
ncbi:hypothetical protein [Kitasatospora sp. GP82]|uniref:hypothetical protein n=1 Tax=Kitasatospora sp. GP82 TaxID=3035089 RepID=UPI002474D0EB|nr:hypothetical protein [Kitasatospora sp. GP82]MDH6129989.1 hypothetical protein [Kitasatospora sp. GP82]